MGGYAVQLAVRDGYRVIAMAGSDGEDWVRSLGAHEVLPRDADLSGAGPVDAVFDAVPLGPESAVAAKDGGVVVFTRSPGDGEPERGVRFKPMLVQPDPQALRALAADLAEGRLRPARVAETLDLAEAAKRPRAGRGRRPARKGGAHLMSLAVALPQIVDDDGYPELLARYASRAEELGFSGLWTLDSAIGGHTSGTPLLDGLHALSFAAAHTERAKLGIAVVVMPRRVPALLARELASIDRLSGGRLIVGVGLGGSDGSEAAFGIPTDRRARRLK